MKLSDYIVDYFDKQGVHVIFGYIGGMITHLVDSIAQNKNLQFVQTYHEQTAAIAAEGYAKESGKFGVAISTSGPGATNMITGIADAYFDSIPVIYITGQVNTYEYKYSKPIRQQGFQETDVVSIVAPITKYAKLIDQKENIRYELEKALSIAKSGRPGPVLLDIPMDIQRADIDPDSLRGFNSIKETFPSFEKEEIARLITKAKRPMVLIGAGCQSSDTKEAVEKFLEQTNFPVITSLMGRGAIDEDHYNVIGMVGSYGNRCANMAVANADLLIALGSRLDTRQTGAMIDSFVKTGTIIHVDIDNKELDNNRLKNRICIHSDVVSFFRQLENIQYNESGEFNEWTLYLNKLKQRYNQEKEIERFVENKAPYRLMQILNKYSKENDHFYGDIGQNQMWAAQTLQLKRGQRFITSGGLAPMGFSMPAAIGASFANPNRTIYSISGDGGFHMAIQSLMLISQYNLPIKVVVLNNNALGMITQFQHLYFEDRMAGTTQNGGYFVPNIKSLANSYGLSYYCISEKDLSNDVLINGILSSRNCIIEYLIEGLTTVCPKLEYNKSIEMPIPLLSEKELLENMIPNK